jgi:hypothetical protein
MVQRRGRTRFALKAFQGNAVLRQVFGKKLDSHVAAQLDVLGAKHHAHAAAAQFLQDAIM